MPGPVLRLPLSVAVELLLVNVWLKLRVRAEDSPDAFSVAPLAMMTLGLLRIAPVPTKARVPWLTVVFPV